MPRWLRRTLLVLLLLAVFGHFARQTEAPPLPSGVTREHVMLDLAGHKVSVRNGTRLSGGAVAFAVGDFLELVAR